MSNFRINTNELSHRATLIKQRGQTLKTLASRLTLQANNFNSGLSLRTGKSFNSRTPLNAGLPDFSKIASIRAVANRLSEFGNWLFNLGSAIEDIVDSALYDDEVDEEYVRRTLSALDSPEELVCRVDDYVFGQPFSSGQNGSNYWGRSLDYAIKGDYSNEFTFVGMLGNIGIGLIPYVGQASDVRDFSYAVSHTNEHSFWGNVGLISLSIIAFIPLIGDAAKNLKYLKYADEVGDVAKQIDNVDDAVRGIARNGDEIIDGIGDVGKNADEIFDAGKGVFKSDELLDTHFAKHGSDFGNITKDEYLKKAQDLVNSSPGNNILTKTRANGDVLFYNKSTNEFAVKAADGEIRTFFKPTDGINYFNRQY